MNQRKPEPTMPKSVVPMPAPPPVARPNRAVHDAYAEEALRAAQRHIDQIQEIDRLGQELEEWRRRALMAESEVKRLNQRETDLMHTLDRQRETLIDERDSYRQKLNHLVSQFHTAGAIILKCLEAAQGVTGPQINFTALAQEIEKIEHQPPEEPLPKVVTAGPAQE